jgi:hypothetical protein
MKTVYWLFIVSVALFVSGIGFVIAGERTARAATPAAAAAPVETAPVATIKQIMIGITNPAVRGMKRGTVDAEGNRGDCAEDRRGVGAGCSAGGRSSSPAT